MDYYRWCDETITEEEWIKIIEEHSTNYKNYYNEEYKRISALDNVDQKVQLRQMIKVMNEMNILEELEKQRVNNEIKKSLIGEGVEFKECPYTSDELKNKWKQAFLSSMTQKDMEECYLDEYLWNAFTYKKVMGYIEGKDATKLFDNMIKDEIYIFWQGEEKVYYLKTNNKFNSKHLRLERHDVYIVDSNFTWTFIYKHCDNEPIWYEKK